MAARRAPMGSVVSDFHEEELRKQLIQQHRVVEDVGAGRREFAQKENRLTQLRSDATDASVVLQSLEAESQALANALKCVENDAAFSTAEKLARMGAIKTNMHKSKRATEMQTAHAKLLDQQVIDAEHDLLQLEVALGRKVQRLEHATSAEEKRLEQQRTVAVARVGAEGRNSEKLADRVLSSTVGAMQKGVTTRGRATEGHEAAHTAHKDAARTLSQTDWERAEVRAAASRLEQAAIDRRIGGILQLKSNLDTVHNDIRSSNARRAERQALKQAAQAEEYHELLAAKQNPYEVWRARERDAKVDRARSEAAARTTAEKLHVAGAVIAEDVRRLPLERKAVEEEEEEEYHRRLKLPVRQQAMATAYVMSKTVGNMQSIDPTGKAIRVEPSTVTSFRTPGFGLGGTALQRPDVVAAIASRPGNESVGPLKQWLPDELRDGPEENDGGEEEEADGGMAALEDEEEGGAKSGAGNLAVDHLAPKAKKYPQRVLSVYEQRLMAAAKERQRASIVRAQVAAGKEFKGAGFACTPAVLHFKDFEVGVPFSLACRLTNASFTFNSFKITPFSDAIRDLFVCDIVPPGRMSAGTSIPFTLTFTPRRNVDISTTLDVYAQTGLVHIPVLCATRKALPAVREPSVGTGEVTLGESKQIGFTVHNEGALSLSITVVRLSEEVTQGMDVSFEPRGEGKAQDNAQEEGSPWSLPKGYTFSLPGYGSVHVPVLFAPHAQGPSALPLRLTFDRQECAPIDLIARGEGRLVPLYVDEDVLDLRTCLLGKLYRAVLTVRNRGSVAMRCAPVLPSGLGTPELEVSPTIGYVQAQDSKTGVPGAFQFTVKFRPVDDMLSRPTVASMLKYEHMQEQEAEDTQLVAAPEGKTDPHASALAPVLHVPMAIVAPDQVLPVQFMLQARVTPADLEFQPTVLDFGSCLVGQAVSKPLRVTNKSALPQKFGFLRVPAAFHVSPAQGDGFGLLLPGESTTLLAVFSPVLAQQYDTAVTCFTNMVGRYTCSLRGTGLSPALQLSHPCVFIAATAVGEVETAYVHVSNSSKNAVEYNVCAPKGHVQGLPPPIRVSPALGVLKGGQSVRLQIQYGPTAEYYEKALKEREEGMQPVDIAAAQLSAMSGNAQLMLAECAPAAVHTDFQVPIYWREASGVDEAKSRSPGPGRRGQGLDAPPLLQTATLLQVSTTAVPRILSLDKRTLVFGPSPVGKGTEQTIRVTNHSNLELDLVPGALNPSGGFALVNAPRTLPPHAYHDVIVTFKPTGHKLFTDRLMLGSKGHGPLAEVIMTGEGVSPTVVLDPPGAGSVDFGAVVDGDVVVRHLHLKNSSAFPLSFMLREEGEGGAMASSAASPVPLFSADPLRGSIPAGGLSRITVTYSPRHAPPGGLAHVVRFLIHVPNQEPGAVQRLHLSGRCFDRSLYAIPALPSDELGALSASAVETHLVAPTTSTGKGVGAGAEVYKLVFGREGETPRGSRGGLGFGSSRGSSPSPRAPATGTSTSGVGAAGGVQFKEMVLACINRMEYNAQGGSSTQPGTAQPSPAKAGAAVASVSSSPPSSYDVRIPAIMVTRTGGSRPHFFSVEGGSGSVAPGSKAVVKFKFSPPTSNSSASAGSSASARAPLGPGGSSAVPDVLGAGEWHEVDAVLTISGGFIALGAQGTKSIIVRLRGFVPGK